MLPETWLKDFLRETKIHTWEHWFYIRSGAHEGANMRAWKVVISLNVARLLRLHMTPRPSIFCNAHWRSKYCLMRRMRREVRVQRQTILGGLLRLYTGYWTLSYFTVREMKLGQLDLWDISLKNVRIWKKFWNLGSWISEWFRIWHGYRFSLFATIMDEMLSKSWPWTLLC